MTKEVELLLKRVIKYDLGIGVILCLLILMILGENAASIYFLGIFIAVVNFTVSGIFLDKSLSKSTFKSKVLFPLSYIMRIFCIAFIALFFTKKLSYLLLYLGGYISHFPILTFCWINKQKGSD